MSFTPSSAHDLYVKKTILTQSVKMCVFNDPAGDLYHWGSTVHVASCRTDHLVPEGIPHDDNQPKLPRMDRAQFKGLSWLRHARARPVHRSWP